MYNQLKRFLKEIVDLREMTFLIREDYVEKGERKPNLICFDKLDLDSSSEFKRKLIDWIKNWSVKIIEN